VCQDHASNDLHGLKSPSSRLLILALSQTSQPDTEEIEPDPVSEEETIKLTKQFAKWGVSVVSADKVIRFKNEFPSSGIIKLAREEEATHILTVYTGHNKLKLNDTQPAKYHAWLTYNLIIISDEFPEDLASDGLEVIMPFHPGVDILGYKDFTMAQHAKVINLCGESLRILPPKARDTSVRPVDNAGNQ
jgi:hypothetical protein